MRHLRIRSRALPFAIFALFYLCAAGPAAAQTTGTVRGTVAVGDAAHTLHNATVLLVPGNRSAVTDDHGAYEFRNVPPGNYSLIIHSSGLSDARRNVTVEAGKLATVDVVLKLAAVREQVTVTATGTQQSTLEAIPATSSLDSIELIQNAAPSLGEALENQPGVAQRGFGPGSSRPVVRGFTGDRVLIMTDGITTGSLGSQSGDHGETIDVLNLDRIEIVRGPATLLYGSNAIGGVVNALSGFYQHDETQHKGLTGYATGLGGTTDGYFGGSFGLEYGWERWKVFGGGNGQRAGDYDTPIGTVPNSRTRNFGGFGGFGWSSGKGYFDLGYKYDNRRYGIPFAIFLESGGAEGGFADPQGETINLRMRAHDIRFNGGFRNLESFITGIRATVNFTRYRHGEFEADESGTQFKNNQLNYRTVFDHRKVGPLSGSFGFSGVQRAFESIGAEALAPPTDQTSFAIFGLEALDFERISFQFGGRFERAAYTTDKLFLPPRPDRDFNGGSAAAGARIPLWRGGAFIANYTRSFRAPALEELYNFGPHPGNLAFEIGNPDLRAESGDGLDLSLRHHSERWRAQANFFQYALDDYIFLAPTGNIVDGLFEAEYLQGPTRYYGGEGSLDLQLHTDLWLLTSVDAVRAYLTESVVSPVTLAVIPADTPLPRIPPLRARVALDWRYKGLGLRPEVLMAAAQDELYVNETRTPGYTVFNLGASYTVAKTHMVHVFSVNAFNLGDRLYFNHVSFIKNLAPEIGRGVRFSYTVRWH